MKKPEPDALTQAEDAAAALLIAKGWNPVAARQHILEDRYRRRTDPPAPALRFIKRGG